MLEETGVPGVAEAALLGEGGGGENGEGFAFDAALPVTGTAESEAVEALDLAGEVEAEAGDAGVVGHEEDFFVEGETREEVGDAGFVGEGGVAEGELGRGLGKGGAGSE